MFNKVVLLGHLTRDIEIRYIQSGTAVGNTAIAVTRKFTGANGEKREETCFIDITFFGRQAEVANQYLNKGSKLLIEGRLKQDTWKDQNGQNRSKHSVVVETMEMLGGPNGGGQSPNNSNYNANSSYNQNYNNNYNQNSFAGGNFGQNSYAQGGFGGNQNFNQRPPMSQQRKPESSYKESIPDVDLDADMKAQNKPADKPTFKDNDEEIPF